MIYIEDKIAYSKRGIKKILKRMIIVQKMAYRDIVRKNNINRIFEHNRPVVYILKSDLLGFLKIGYTKDINKRVRQLNSQTAGPGDWKVIALYESDNPFDEETKVHKSLWNKRLSNHRGFFKASVGPVVKHVNDILRREPEFIMR